MFNVKDVLAAFQREEDLAPSDSVNSIAIRLEVRIRDKWKQANANLVLLDQKSVAKKMSRLYESALKGNR